MAPRPERKSLTRAGAERHAQKLEHRKNTGDKEKAERLRKALEQPGEEVNVDAMDLDDLEDEAEQERDDGRSGGEGAQDAARTDTETRDAPRLQEDQPSNDTQSAGRTAALTSNNTQPAAQPANNNRSQPDIVDSTEDEPLFIPEQTREADEDSDDDEALYLNPSTALDGNVTTVGWTRSMYINRHGPKNAAQYRIDHCPSPEYRRLPEEDVSDPENRYGDQKTGKQCKYGSGHIHGIFGIAWVGGNSDLKDDLRLINPATKEGRFPLTYVLVAWRLDPGKKEITKKWETRSALRARWGSGRADKHIYAAACKAQERYEETTNGKRMPASRSPSVGLIRDASVFPDRVSPSRSPSRRASVDSGSDSTKTYLRSFLYALGKDRFTELNEQERDRLMKGLESRV